jgi:hypothetical protein
VSPSTSLFAPVDLTPHVNAAPAAVVGRWHAAVQGAAARVPTGTQRFWGVPFTLVSPAGDASAPAWVVAGHDTADTITIPLGGERPPSYLLVAHLCGAPVVVPAGGAEPAGAAWPGALTRAGDRVADYVLVYADGTEHRQAIRWRFEISAPGDARVFAARPQGMDTPVDFRGPYPRDGWGRAQRALVVAGGGPYWVYALPNPTRGQSVRALRIEGAGIADVCIGALTQFYGRDHPLRHRQLETFRITLPAAPAGAEAGSTTPPPGPQSLSPDAVPASIDLGIIARRYAVPAFDPDTWLAGEGISSPLPAAVPPAPAEVFLDVTASADATLAVGEHAVPLREAYETGEARSTDGVVRIEVVHPQRTWLHVTVEDGATGRPAPSRVHFRDGHGRYLPPYGFRHEVNDNWFEDYGNDLKLHGTEYAYVDGTFQAELPVGEVYAEVFKGFEYRPLRQQLTIAPGQRDLVLRLQRPLDWRRQGWMTADTHVHFLSPQTAWLQGRAEGLNLVNLLASQWGDLFTNVGDISGDAAGSRDDTVVWVGTENRQHILGHISLLGVKGDPVFPMATAGPNTAYLGEPLRMTMAEWADEARRKDGVVVLPHFPNPYTEVTADILLQKVDAVELRMGAWMRASGPTSPASAASGCSPSPVLAPPAAGAGWPDCRGRGDATDGIVAPAATAATAATATSTRFSRWSCR